MSIKTWVLPPIIFADFLPSSLEHLSLTTIKLYLEITHSHFTLLQGRNPSPTMSSLTMDALKAAAAFGRPGIQVISGRHLESDFALITKQNAPQKRHWLPLAVSKDHWVIVRDDVYSCLQTLKTALPYKSVTEAQILYQFASDIVGKFNRLEINNRDPQYAVPGALSRAVGHATKSFYQVVQLLLCIAADDKVVVNQAGHLIGLVMNGRVRKGYIPNLAHVFMATMISAVPLTTQAKNNLVKEAIIRSVAWTLKDEPPLEYLEKDPVSSYRLDQTFQVSKKHLRYLLLCYVFASNIRPEGMEPIQLRDQLMETFSLPTDDQLTTMTKAVAAANKVADFADLLKGFGFGVMPTQENFITVLRDAVVKSHERGYSQPALSQEDAFKLCITRDCGMNLAPK
jgi:hypothetical protein